MMELTIGELRIAHRPLAKILITEQPFRLAYRLKKIAKILEKELREIEEVRVERVKKYGKVLPQGGFQVIEENMETYQTEMQEIDDTKITLDIQPIPIELLEGVRLSPQEVVYLEKFIEEPAGASPAQKEGG